jgi:hypothetical protein
MKRLQSIHQCLILAAAVAWPSLAGAATTNWVTYADYKRGTTTAPNVFEYAPTAVGTVGGLLTNFDTGTLLPSDAGLQIGIVGTLNGNSGGSGAPNAGTPADQLFTGKVTWGASALYFGGGAAASSEIRYTFTNLTAGKKYVFRGTAVRGNAYATRWTMATIEAASSIPAHIQGTGSRGIITNGWAPYGDTLQPNIQAAWNAGDNLFGDVIGWDEIVPNGTSFSVICTNWVEATPGGAGNTTYSYAFEALMLAEVEYVACTTPITITTQPLAPAVTELQPFTLSVAAEGCVSGYQWYYNFAPIAGATRASYTDPNPMLIPFDTASGEYWVVLTGDANPGGLESDHVFVTVQADTVAPTLVSAVGAADGINITATFSKPMDQSLLTDGVNYLISDGVNSFFASAVTIVNPTTVTLTTDPRLPNTDYTLEVFNVTDTTSLANPIQPPNNKVTIQAQVVLLTPDDTTHQWKYESSNINEGGTGWQSPGFDDSLWTNGVQVFTQEPSPGDTATPWVSMTFLPIPSAAGATTGSGVTTYYRTHFTLPSGTNGLRLFLRQAMDDGGVFYLNGQEAFRTNMPAGAPAWDTLSSITAGETSNNHTIDGPFELPITNLVAGDNVLAVEVHQSATTSSDVLLGAELTAQIAHFASGPVVITTQPAGGTINEGQNFSFSVKADGQLPFSYQWYRNNAAITDATNSSYFIASANKTQDEGDYRVDVTNPQGTVPSGTAHLTVNADTTRPVVLSANGGAATNLTIVVAFSKHLDAVSAQATGNYQLAGPGGLTITSAVLQNNTNVVLTLSGLRTPNQGYTLTVKDVTDTAFGKNVIDPNPTVLAVGALIELISINTHAWKYHEEAVLDAPYCLDGEAWMTPGYNDTTWSNGFGIFYGNRTNSVSQPAPNAANLLPFPLQAADTNNTLVYTIVNLFTNAANTNQALTWYFRTTFNFPAQTNGAVLLAHAMIDDGAVFYLNGERLHDVRLTNNPVYCTNFASGGNQNWEPALTAAGAAFGLTGLKTGLNTLAVEVHQSAIDSSDITLGLLLEAEVQSFTAGPTQPTLHYTVSADGKSITFTWDAGYVLKESNDVAGPYTTTVSTTSPKTVSTTTGTKFYRLSQ